MLVPVRLAARAFAALFALSLVAATAPAASAQQGSPKAFLDAIYKQYLAKSFKVISLSEAAAVQRYFEPQLAAAMIKDFSDAQTRNEPPQLNGDPFLDAQDWEISNLSVSVKDNGADTAAATVTFNNFGKRQTIAIELVRTANGWRIAEIRAPSGSLRGLYKLR